MWDKVRKRIVDACDVMDMVMAAVVVIGIVIAVIGIFPQIGELWRHREETIAFLEFLDAVLGVVIGVEFLKMLNTANIIEALIFVIARHMIVQTTTAGEDLVSVISICMLFLFRRFMLATKPDKEHHVPNIFKAIKIAQSPEFQEALKETEEHETISQDEK